MSGLPAAIRVRLPSAFYETVRQQGIPFTRDTLWVRILRQQVIHFRSSRFRCPTRRQHRFPDFALQDRPLRCSTSKFGIGQAAGSNCTPLGLHRVAEKIGAGWPPGAVFKSRQMIGYTWQGLPSATITNRILWLEGLEPGFNRGGNVDTHARYIYIHGTGDEPSIGRPASHGCVHLSGNDLIPLFDRLPTGTLVWISRH